MASNADSKLKHQGGEEEDERMKTLLLLLVRVQHIIVVMLLHVEDDGTKLLYTVDMWNSEITIINVERRKLKMCT